MAGQFQIAYSRNVTGAALVAGGPYGCARTPAGDLNPFWPAVLSWNLLRAQNNCMEDGWFFSSVPNADDLFDEAKRLSESGKIDPIEHLLDDKVYLFSSQNDDTVERGVVEGAYEFYRAAGVPEANLRFEKNDKAAHAFLTENEGLSCGKSGPPFLNDCDLDQAKAILEWLLGPLQPATSTPPVNFIQFEQASYADGLSDAGLGEQAMAYIPDSCRSQNGCLVHVVFHGCKQGFAVIGDAFIKGSGYARWAESNRIVLLFPQVVASTLNPNGCWDWWGYTGRNFLERDAPQMLAVKQMIDRLAQH